MSSTPLHLADFSSPALPQHSSALFTTLPGEIRNHIFSFALADYEDNTRVYDDTTCYKRPNYLAPRRTDTAILRTCQRIFREAWFLPWTNAEHTFWLTEAARMPPSALIVEATPDGTLQYPSQIAFSMAHKLRDALAAIAESVRKTHGTVPTIDQIRVFAQLYMLENGVMLTRLLGTPHFLPIRVTITLRHTDWWHWEQDHVLRIGAGWVNECKFPISVKEVRLELESLERKKEQVDSLAKQMAKNWIFTRADGVKLVAKVPSPTDVMRWSGTSAWNEVRWLRDEVRPGEVDYYVAAVVWRTGMPASKDLLGRSAPDLVAEVGTPIPRAHRQRVDLARLNQAGIGLDVPACEVMPRLDAWLLARPRRAPLPFSWPRR